VFEEEQGQGALQPFLKIFLNLSPLMLSCERHAYRGLLIDTETTLKPFRFAESVPVECHRERRCVQFNDITKTKSALEPNAPEADRMKGALVRVPEPTQGCEVLFGEVLSVVR